MPLDSTLPSVSSHMNVPAPPLNGLTGTAVQVPGVPTTDGGVLVGGASVGAVVGGDVGAVRGGGVGNDRAGHRQRDRHGGARRDEQSFPHRPLLADRWGPQCPTHRRSSLNRKHGGRKPFRQGPPSLAETFSGSVPVMCRQF